MGLTGGGCENEVDGVFVGQKFAVGNFGNVPVASGTERDTMFEIHVVRCAKYAFLFAIGNQIQSGLNHSQGISAHSGEQTDGPQFH